MMSIRELFFTMRVRFIGVVAILIAGFIMTAVMLSLGVTRVRVEQVLIGFTVVVVPLFVIYERRISGYFRKV